jgi:hypothetical protein
LERFLLDCQRGVSHRDLWGVAVSSSPLRQVMPRFANTIRLCANTPSPIAPWKCLNPR